jgi:hypothetical protein
LQPRLQFLNSDQELDHLLADFPDLPFQIRGALVIFLWICIWICIGCWACHRKIGLGRGQGGQDRWCGRSGLSGRDVGLRLGLRLGLLGKHHPDPNSAADQEDPA